VRVVIAGGGTAGHVNPALAVAGALGSDVLFMGTRAGSEARLVPAAGWPLETVEVRGFDRSRPWSIIGTAAVAARAVLSARRVLSSHRPDVVLGMGGYVSLPACIAARSLRIPVALHEQNVVLGLANRTSKPLARKIAVSFEDTLAKVGRKGVYTGNPVRPDFVEADLGGARKRGLDAFELEDHRKTLLVFGGSQGAQRINEAAAGLAGSWRDSADRQILHIAGPDQEAGTRARTADSGNLVYRVLGYVDDMVAAYAVADLALCRGGATTVAELGVMGVPSIIVPYPHHRDRQQERHGVILQRAGAAVVVPDANTTTDHIAGLAARLLDDDEGLEKMRAAALDLGRPDAAGHVAALLQEIAP
jgi:UDP-N-acetylglucosamine--N-acetylmuramyl-(pentapeptide) pyrophosphoryl-undecaprenol N-acetylglucosamine transferase